MEFQEIIDKLKEHEDRIKKLEGTSSFSTETNPLQIQRNKSIREFLNEFRFKTATDRTLVIMHFFELFRSKRKLTAQEIRGGFKELREKSPKNIFDKLQMLDKKALIMADGKEGKCTLWTITSSGLDYLEKLKRDV